MKKYLSAFRSEEQKKDLTLESPWNRYHKKLMSLFMLDPDIVVENELTPVEDDSSYDFIISIKVSKHDKYMALRKLMGTDFKFGNVHVHVDIYDTENEDVAMFDDMYWCDKLFDGNPIVKDIRHVTDRTGTSRSYIRFQPEVVQFFDDNLSDFNGNWTGLAQDIAKEVFSVSPAVCFCTADIKENANK